MVVKNYIIVDLETKKAKVAKLDESVFEKAATLDELKKLIGYYDEQAS